MGTTAPSSWKTLSTRKAFAIHLTLSLLIFSSLVFVMLMWWFPGELFFLDGGWQGLKIVALIDLVLGPLLTLVLYKPGKKDLVFDMSCVAAFQLAALAYGFYATHQQRTVAVVFADRNFTTLSADSAIAASQELIDLELTPQNIKAIDDSYPAILLTPEPAPGKFGEYVSNLLKGYPESHERLDLFEKLSPKHAETLSVRAKSKEDLELTGADEYIAKAMQKGGYDEADIEVHHFKARYSKGLVLYSKSQNEILDYIPMPWDELLAKKTAELEAAGLSDAPDTQDEKEAKTEIAESDEQ